MNWNLLIHRAWAFFAMFTLVIGLVSVYLGVKDSGGLPHGWFVYVFFGSIEAVLSLWTIHRMGEHIYDIKIKAAIAYWDNYHAEQRKANTTRVPATR
jgi:hypothetical protein